MSETCVGPKGGSAIFSCTLPYALRGGWGQRVQRQRCVESGGSARAASAVARPDETDACVLPAVRCTQTVRLGLWTQETRARGGAHRAEGRAGAPRADKRAVSFKNGQRAGRGHGLQATCTWALLLS